MRNVASGMSLALAWLLSLTGAQGNEKLTSSCRAVTVASVHRLTPGGEHPFPANQRLAPIENETVPCIHAQEHTFSQCVFRIRAASFGGKASGDWLTDKHGHAYAKVGQTLTTDGNSSGPYVVAARVTDKSVPCVGASGYDRAGIASTTELGGACVTEIIGSATNAMRSPLRNFATQLVCTTSYPHPDGVTPVSINRATGVYCYTGQGAALNDPNGNERDRNGQYLPGATACHVYWNGGYEFYASKRPATVSYPFPGRVNVRTPILWRPVTSVRVAN